MEMESGIVLVELVSKDGEVMGAQTRSGGRVAGLRRRGGSDIVVRKQQFLAVYGSTNTC